MFEGHECGDIVRGLNGMTSESGEPIGLDVALAKGRHELRALRISEETWSHIQHTCKVADQESDGSFRVCCDSVTGAEAAIWRIRHSRPTYREIDGSLYDGWWAPLLSHEQRIAHGLYADGDEYLQVESQRLYAFYVEIGNTYGFVHLHECIWI